MNLINQIIVALGGWEAIINALVPIILALLGLPYVVKDPNKLPVVGRLYPVKDELTEAFEAWRVLDKIAERKNVPAEERKRLLERIFSPEGK
jgi:hypothetical protein